MTKVFVGLALVAWNLFTAALAGEVVVLTESNFDEVVAAKPTLVEFYAPWCGHCKKLEPEYNKAAELIEEKGVEVQLAKVDATAEEALAKKYEIQGFPTLIYFNKDSQVPYSGDRTAPGIVQWLEKKTGPPAKTIETEADLDKLKEENDVVAVGVFKDDSEASGFLKAAETDDEVPYAIYTNGDLAGESAPSIVVYKNFDEGKAVFEGDQSDPAAIKKFVAGNVLPLVVPFSQENAQKIFSGGINKHCLVFVDATQAEAKQAAIDAVTPVARDYKGEFLFVTVDKTDERILEFFGITEDMLPTLRIINMGDGGMKKFKPPFDGVKEAETAQFIKDYLDGKVEQELKSEDPIEDSEQTEAVFKLVGKNFDEKIKEKKVNFVMFHAPWCGHCKKLKPTWEELANAFTDDEDVRIAAMDATANEIASLSISGFPTLKLFKGEEIIDYDGERELSALQEFVEKHK